MEDESDYGFPAWATGQVETLMSDAQIAWEQVLWEKLDFALGQVRFEMPRRHSSRDFEKLQFDNSSLEF